MLYNFLTGKILLIMCDIVYRKRCNILREKALIDVYILEILEKYASKEKKITQERIIEILDGNYRLPISRRSLSGYLSELRTEGYIEGQRGIYKVNKFSDTELRFLIDSVLFAKHIQEDDARILINKLKSMSNQQFEKRIKHVHYLSEIQHTDNVIMYKNLDDIDAAIEKNRKIKVSQSMYTIDGELKEKSTAILSPYYIVTSNAKYYLICHKDGNKDLGNRRIDRITKVEELDEKRTQIRELEKYSNGNFSLPQYMKEHIYMFSGNSEYITAKVKKDSIGEVIDWYGKGYRVLEDKGTDVIIKLYANTNAVYYWAMQYGSVVEVLAPEKLRTRIRTGVFELLNKYNKNL